MLSYRCNDTNASYPVFITRSLIIVLLLFSSAVCTSAEILIGTGEPGSFSYFAGKSLCQAVERYNTDLTCTPVPSSKAADNLTNLQNDSIDLALTSSKIIYNAFHQTGSFEYINIDYNNLRLLMPMYKTPVSLVARRDANICCFNDLEGKRVNCGQLNTEEHLIFKELMTTKNWHDSNFSLLQNLPASMSQDSLALQAGTVQALFHVGMHPDKELSQLLRQKGNMLVPLADDDIDKLISNRVGFSRCKIAAGTYPGITEDLTTLAMENLLIASDATDSTIIDNVLTSLHKAQQQLRHAHPSLLRQHTTVSTLNDSYLHPHPSALLFFQSTRTLY